MTPKYTYHIDTTRDREGNEQFYVTIADRDGIFNENTFYSREEAEDWVARNYLDEDIEPA